MPSESKKAMDGGPSGVASTAAIPGGPLKRHRLPYRRPLPPFLPLVFLFLLFNYLAFAVEVDDKEGVVLLPEYVRGIARKRDALRQAAAAGQVLTEPIPFSVFLFLEESVMGTLFQVGRFLFRSHFGIQVVCVLAWLVHLFELGVCFRICWSCNASFLVALRYMYCTSVGGFTQLSPLIQARDAWVREMRATEELKSKKSQ
ncbi:putative Domain (DUF4499) [Leishmania utingensis]|uniref:Domain (DUF4499) n=1 Tax=Leishmania utingensis TaxID=653362 RepID=A0AAW3ALR5_9TRYP